MKAFEFDNYKDYLNTKLKTLPKKGHGELRRIAQALDIHTTMVTHIFKGNSHLSFEQCLKLCKHWGLNELETEYFIALVLKERAGDKNAREYCLKQIEKLKQKAQNLSVRLEVKNTLDEKDQAIYYSNWYYTATRLLTDIPKYQNADAMSKRLGLTPEKISQILEFLIQNNLVVEKNNSLEWGPTNTYISKDSKIVSRHHTNWRLKSISQFDDIKSDDLIFTQPCVLSEKDFLKIREKLIQFIEDFKKTIEPSASEELFCLNIDWIKIK